MGPQFVMHLGPNPRDEINYAAKLITRGSCGVHVNSPCLMQLGVGREAGTFSFNVERLPGMPYIRLIPKVTAVAGETLQLKCPVAGYPIEEIHWERAGRELPDDLRQKVLADGTLVITPVEKKADSGVYTCWARNKQGHSARRSGEVSVIGQ